jgi:5-methylcytosine-specific restriction protein A
MMAPDRRARNREHNAKRGSARERGYNTRWEKARKTYLMRNPLCVMCQKEGRVTAATVVDHIIPHKGDTALFWDTENNWMSLCAHCHNSTKQRMEKGRFQVVGEDGWPVE